MEFRVLTRILKIGVEMAPSRNSWSFSIHLYWDFSKSWSQIQKVGVNYSKFGVNETSGIDKLDVNTFFKMSPDSRTRGHNFKFKIFKKQIRTRMMFIKHYAPNRCLCIKVAKSTMCN